VTDKITLQANVEYNVWDYHGGLANEVFGEGTRHRVRLFGASISYRPTPKILLQAGINREERSSNAPFADYEVDVAFIEGRIGF
jgi:hypothetical protein